MAWLPTYSKRKPITLTGGASGAQTDFQLKLAVAYAAAMQSDFDDVRFTQADGTTLIDAWLESKVNDDSAEVWAEFPTTPANTVEQTYYMYYGNAGAANYWDGDATFPDFFDDFESVADWDYLSNYNATSYSFTALDGIGDMMVSATNDNHIVRYKKDCNFNTSARQMLLRFKGDANTKININGSGDQYWKSGYWMDSPAAYTTYDETWFSNGAITFVRIDTRGVVSGTQHNYFDYIAFHKYAANPPTYAFGSEESAPAVGAIMNQFQKYNLGADLYNGGIIA